MLFLCLSTQINLHHVLKMSAIGTYAAHLGFFLQKCAIYIFTVIICIFSFVNTTGQRMHQLCVVQCGVKRLSS